MQVELTSVVAFVGAILTTFLGIYIALLRYAVAQREKEIDRRINLCDAENVRLATRITEEEKRTIHQDGQLLLVKQTHDDAKSDIDEVKRTMVTKAEWEPRMTNLERTANSILAELRGGRHSSGGMPAVKVPTPR